MKNKGLGKINNADDLLERLLDAYNRVEDEKLPVSYAKEMNAFAKNALSIIKSQLLYASMKGYDPEIPFLESGDVKQIEGKK